MHSLAWHVFRCVGVVSRLSTLCTWQGQPTAHCSSTANTDTRAAFHVHMDLVGPLPTSAEGFKYLFTIVDRSPRWLEAAPLKSMAAEDCVDALISSWVAMFGVPTIITSDQGRQFTSSLWAGLTKLLGIKHVQTTAYHQQFNGMVERTHGQLKAALRAQLAGSRRPEHLPWVLLGLHTALKEDSGILAAELVYGAALALPAEFLPTAEPAAADFLKKLQQVELPATKPLRRRCAGQPHLCAAQRHVAAPVTAIRGSVRGAGENRKVFPASSGRPRGDGQHRPPEAASGSRAFHGGPPGGTRPPPGLRSGQGLMRRTPALAPCTILCSRYIESVFTPSPPSPPPPTRLNSFLARV